MDRYQKGIEEMRRHFGDKADEHIAKIREVAPLFAKVNVEFAFGDIYGDEKSVLDQKTKELCTIAALTALGFPKLELKLHVLGALKCGATQEEIVEVITQMILYCGFPAATEAILIAREVFLENKK